MENNIDIVTGHMGGHNVTHDVKTKELDVKVPAPKKEQQLGLAKASPNFKKVPAKTKADPADEKKAIEKNEEKVD